MKNRSNWVPAPHYFELNQACHILAEAFGYNFYLVGSSIQRRDYRDVDVRCILPDERYAELFGDLHNAAVSARLSVMNAAFSLWLSKQSGLPIDFQFQQQTHANAANPKGEVPGRHPLGIFITPNPPEKGG